MASRQLLSFGLGALLLSTPMAGLPLAELQALNRELGRLCNDPPREALVENTFFGPATMASERYEANVRRWLEARGFVVDHVAHGDEGFTLAMTRSYDAVVLDIMLPGRDGLSVLRQLRERSNRTPVLLLSARGEVNERVEGLNAGADDYLPKPFALAELVARVRALGRRGTSTVLSIVLSRLYVLRNQLVHGGATWNGKVNRAQVRDGANLLGKFVPAVIADFVAFKGPAFLEVLIDPDAGGFGVDIDYRILEFAGELDQFSVAARVSLCSTPTEMRAIGVFFPPSASVLATMNLTQSLETSGIDMFHAHGNAVLAAGDQDRPRTPAQGHDDQAWRPDVSGGRGDSDRDAVHASPLTGPNGCYPIGAKSQRTISGLPLNFGNTFKISGS